MMKVVVLLFVWGLAFGVENHCHQDTTQLCANIKNGLNTINSGAQQVGRGIHVEEVKKIVDGPQEASIVHGNFTLLLMAVEKYPLDSAGRKCLKDRADQSTAVANYIDTISNHLQNDREIEMDVQRNLRSVSKLYEELETPSNTLRIGLERNKICQNINANFGKIDSGATNIANGEDVSKVKAEGEEPQLASDIKYDYIRLTVVSLRIDSNDIVECLAKTAFRAEQQVKQIEAILDKHTDDKNRVNAVFKDFKEINEIERQRIDCART